MQGELAALSAAFFWALSTVLFGRLGKALSPLSLNLVKGVIAIALTLLTLLLQAKLQPTLPLPATIWLLLSGVVGIGLGDTAYFTALNTLGARRVLLLESLAPPMTALLAGLFLNEQLSAIAWGGILLTLIGVAWVISERIPADTIHPTRRWQGIMWGLLATVAQASGAVMSRGALVDAAIDPLWSALLRITAGVGVLGVLVSIKGQVGAQLSPLRSRRLMFLVVLAAFLGTHLGIWLQQVSFKYTAAGIAQALLATSPLFVLPIAAIMGDRITWRAVMGVLVAIGGIWLLTGRG